MPSPYPGLTLDDIPTSIGRYPYKKVDASKYQFRLFILYPRTSSRPEDLRITIFEDVLDGNDQKMVKSFQALSYVWGDATKRQDLMVIVPVGEIEAVCKLSVTANLAEALVHYPFRDGHVVLWADAICINQDDHEERAQQVRLMQRIYSEADIVTAWLGHEAENSNLAMNLLTRIGESADPDYTKSVVQVYRDLVIADMTVNGRADLLAECYSSDNSTWAPSWIPDWSTMTKLPIAVFEACADGQSAAAATLCPDQKTLAIKGKLLATVSDAWEPLHTQDNLHQDLKMSRLATMAAVKECAQRIALSARYPSGGDNLEALCVGLSGGQVTDNYVAQLQQSSCQSIAQYKAFIDFALSFDNTPTDIHRLADPDILGCVASASHTLLDSMVATVEGYLGFCPVSARPGDRVCILLGCMKPMILRPTRGNNSCYTVVGPCNMHGLNWGEGLLGPLPDNTTFVWNQSGPRGGTGPAFKNRYTGEETIVDPRIDWDLLDVGNNRELAFAQRMPPDRSRIDYFKRPDVEYFEKRGIELITFDLV
ncbi:heterokaryon incompatibility protein 6 [Hyaloscypha finlandica]|nr:heterokaryon incompatibility protein 6 [Hyaloscypha finlandica]